MATPTTLVDEHCKYIVVSFVNWTIVLSIGETVVEVTDSGHAHTQTQTYTHRHIHTGTDTHRHDTDRHRHLSLPLSPPPPHTNQREREREEESDPLCSGILDQTPTLSLSLLGENSLLQVVLSTSTSSVLDVLLCLSRVIHFCILRVVFEIEI